MQQYCDQLHQWCIKWRIKINCNKGKTEALVINIGQSDLPKLTIGSSSIEYVKESPVLGIILDEELSFRDQILKVVKSCFFVIRTLSRIKHFLTYDQLRTAVSALVFSRLTVIRFILG